MESCQRSAEEMHALSQVSIEVHELSQVSIEMYELLKGQQRGCMMELGHLAEDSGRGGNDPGICSQQVVQAVLHGGNDA